MLVVVPLRGFADAKTRLGTLSADHRRALARAVANHVVTIGRDAGHEVVVVTGAADVSAWCADRAIPVVADPGDGLDAAAALGIAGAGSLPWAVVHGDLPLLTAADLSTAAAGARDGATVLAPSRDGGTNLIAATGDFRFRYGPGSFARHLASASLRSPRVLVSVGLAVEIDTPADLNAAISHPAGGWIRAFLS